VYSLTEKQQQGMSSHGRERGRLRPIPCREQDHSRVCSTVILYTDISKRWILRRHYITRVCILTHRGWVTTHPLLVYGHTTIRVLMSEVGILPTTYLYMEGIGMHKR